MTMTAPKWNEQENQWGTDGERWAAHWMISRGEPAEYQVTHHPLGRYGPDLLVESKRETFYLEVEHRNTFWQRGPWPYWTKPDIHIPGRRQFLPGSIFLTLSNDMTAGLFAFEPDITEAPLKEGCKNRRVIQGETMRSILWQRCLPIDLNDYDRRTLAEQNAARIREAMGRIKDRTSRQKYLYPSCPYGLPVEEWERYQHESFALALLPMRPPVKTEPTTLFDCLPRGPK
jgi:hypothetical protein